MKRWFGCAVPIALVLFGCGGGSDSSSADTPYAGYESTLYAGLDNWLCDPSLPDENDLCAIDLDATVVNADGSTEAEPHVASQNPAFDCFYVYPTVSIDAGMNSDLEPNEEEVFIISEQAARLNRHCRVFAPVYRQVTISGLFAESADGWAIAYADVLDAFREYIANRNDGRGFVLVGHSQGTGHLVRLIAEEVESQPYLSERLISAYLLGGTVQVPRGQDVGGTFASTPLCRSATQFGCVVTYATYRASDPPSMGALFGGASKPDNVAGCVNPAALEGGPAFLDSYFPSEITGFYFSLIGEVSPWANPGTKDPIATPYYKMPGFLEAECVEQNGFSYLSVTPKADAADPRADDIKGDFTEGWGLHLVDMTVAMGDILDLIEQQATGWQATR
jgi:hypothetical protein